MGNRRLRAPVARLSAPPLEIPLQRVHDAATCSRRCGRGPPPIIVGQRTAGRVVSAHILGCPRRGASAIDASLHFVGDGRGTLMDTLVRTKMSSALSPPPSRRQTWERGRARPPKS
eukprot:scaffold104315_cov75-Phaeocystis_antarctica.AAC.5